MGIAQLVIFFLFSLFAEQIKDFVRNYYEETYQNMVKLLNVLKYISLFSGIFDVGYGAYLLAKVVEEEDNPNLGECPDCQKMVSIHASFCPHCGCNFDSEYEELPTYQAMSSENQIGNGEKDRLNSTPAEPVVIVNPQWVCAHCSTEIADSFLTCVKCGRLKRM